MASNGEEAKSKTFAQWLTAQIKTGVGQAIAWLVAAVVAYFVFALFPSLEKYDPRRPAPPSKQSPVSSPPVSNPPIAAPTSPQESSKRTARAPEIRSASDTQPGSVSNSCAMDGWQIGPRACAFFACEPSRAQNAFVFGDWVNLTLSIRNSCDLAGREALGEYRVFSRLHALIEQATPTSTHAAYDTCLEHKIAIIEGLDALRVSLRPTQSEISRCPTNPISSKVQDFLSRLAP